MNGEGEMEPGSKWCRDCCTVKPLAEFSPNKRSREGVTSYCKPCLLLRHRGYREARRTGPRTRVTRAMTPDSDTQKWCASCATMQAREAFGKNRTMADGLTAYCKPCHTKRGAESRERNGGARNYHLMRRYGITVADYDRLVAEQGGLCALCRDRAPEHVDHDHVTGLVRGVLCSCCNQGLGNFRDDVASLRAAVTYLERTTWQRHQESTGVYRLTSPRPEARRSASSSALQRLICSRRDVSSPQA